MNLKALKRKLYLNYVWILISSILIAWYSDWGGHRERIVKAYAVKSYSLLTGMSRARFAMVAEIANDADGVGLAAYCL